MTPRPRRRSSVVVALALLAALAPAPAAAERSNAGGEPGAGPRPRALRGPEPALVWSDVAPDHWARAAIDLVAGANPWMRDHRPGPDGTYPFRPDRLERRALFARALVRAFAPAVQVDPSIAFDDLDPQARAYRFANVVVQLGWMTTEGASFRPRDPVTTREVHRALVLALGLGEEAAGLDALHTADGYTFETPDGFGTLLLGMLLGLRYDHRDDALDVGPDTPLTRAEVAWSLARAATAPGWRIAALAPYATIELPPLSEEVRRVVEFGIRYVGYPYVWGGEWAEPTGEGYCCGVQPVGGFDCSGLAWWLLKAPTGAWDNVPPRTYEGWDLPQRSSAEMAAAGERLPFERARPGDLLFYDGDGDRRVDHVNVYLGGGWALDSSGGAAGVTIRDVSTGWYRDRFAWARRIL